MEVSLVVAAGKAKGRVVPLPASIFVIGRGAQSHLRAHCKLVSRRHCAIAQWAGKVVVRDLRSINGTFVNDDRITGEMRVKDGDVLRVGTLSFTFKIAGAPLPVAHVPGSAVKWLMDSTGDTTLVPGDVAGPMPTTCADPDDPADSAVLSAGEYLQSLVRKPQK
jgi:pSer/pThr/pTyr-binding forkhead associated (FHA) protein